MTATATPQSGQVIHFLVSGFTHHRVIKSQLVAFVSRRGDELTITEELLDASRDRNGALAPWLTLVHDAEAQRRRFGHVIAAPGGFPDDLLRTEPGAPEHDEARRAAVREAKQISDKAEQRKALTAIEKRYGPAQPTSRTHAAYSR